MTTAGIGAAILYRRSRPAISFDFTAMGSLDPSFTFARASHATLFDATGSLTFAPNNIVTHSATFSNAAWTKENSAFASDTVTASAGAGYHSIYGTTESVSPATPVIVTFDVEAGTAQYVTIGDRADAGWRWASFDFQSPAISGSFGVTASGFVDLGGGRYRVWIKFTRTNAGAINPFVAPNPVGNALHTYTAAGTETVKVYASTVSLVTYETAPRAGDRLATGATSAFGPRLDFGLASTTPTGLLIEEARTNIALWNRDLTNAAWAHTNVTAAKNETGIDGLASSASRLTATAGNGTSLQTVTLASSQRRMSAYVRRVTGTGTIEMTTDGGTTWTAITITSSWARYSITAQTVTNPVFGFRIVTSGDAIAVDCVQNETGSFTTSPIINGATANQRVAEVVTFGSAAADILSGANGSIIAETSGLTQKSTENAAIVSASSLLPLYVTTSSGVGSAVVASSNGVVALTTTARPTYTSAFRMGLAWSPGRRALTFNANAPDISATSTGTSSTYYLGSQNGTSSFLSGRITRLALYRLALADDTLRARTVVGAGL